MIVHGKVIEFFPYVYAPSREESRFKEFPRRSQMRQMISRALYDRTSLHEKSAYALHACTYIYIYICVYVCVCVCVYIMYRETMTQQPIKFPSRASNWIDQIEIDLRDCVPGLKCFEYCSPPQQCNSDISTWRSVSNIFVSMSPLKNAKYHAHVSRY